MRTSIRFAPTKTFSCSEGGGGGIYNPQKTAGKPYHALNRAGTTNYHGFNPTPTINSSGLRFPRSVVHIATIERGLHPTQKPVALFEYLIRTYTNPGAVVLDNCIGSGTTAIACINSGRHFIGFDKDKSYCEIARERIRKHVLSRTAKAA